MQKQCRRKKTCSCLGTLRLRPAGTDYEFKANELERGSSFFRSASNRSLGKMSRRALRQFGESRRVRFLGNKNARLQKLLPDTLAFDMAVNIFVYQPGTALPFVETHIWKTDC